MTFQEIIRDFAESEIVPEAAIRMALAGPDAFVGDAVAMPGRSNDQEERALAILIHILGEIGEPSRPS